MKLQSFFGFLSPGIKYSLMELPLEEVPLSEKAVMLIDKDTCPDGPALYQGDQILTGQKVLDWKGSPVAVSTLTGTIQNLYEFECINGTSYTAIEIERTADHWDDGLPEGINTSEAGPDEIITGLKGLGITLPLKPGASKILISCLEEDIDISNFINTVKGKHDSIRKGVDLLKKISGAESVEFIIFQHYIKYIRDIINDYPSHILKPKYPDGLPEIILKNIGLQNREDISLISIGRLIAAVEALESGRPVTEKIITLATREKDQVKNLRVRIGTPLSEVLRSSGITLREKEKVITGGSMRGSAAYQMDFPVTFETEALMVQGADEVCVTTGARCVACGKCVSVCPRKLQVNLLSRYAEFGIFEKCRELDLDYCIDCGLCAYVCSARRPLVQLMSLAKKELIKTQQNEENQ